MKAEVVFPRGSGGNPGYSKPRSPASDMRWKRAKPIFQGDMPVVSWLRKIFVFNQAERDLWVEKQAAAIPAGSRVLDVGAGSCRYRALFRHCEYRSQDFAELPDEQLGRGATYGRMDYISDILAIPVAELRTLAADISAEAPRISAVPVADIFKALAWEARELATRMSAPHAFVAPRP